MKSTEQHPTRGMALTGSYNRATWFSHHLHDPTPSWNFLTQVSWRRLTVQKCLWVCMHYTFLCGLCETFFRFLIPLTRKSGERKRSWKQLWGVLLKLRSIGWRRLPKLTGTVQDSKLGGKIQSHLPSGDDVRVKSSHNFVTAREVLVARAAVLVAFATVLVAVSSPTELHLNPSLPSFGSIIIFHLSKLWKAKFLILCDVIFLVRLQGEFEIYHFWGWKG